MNSLRSKIARAIYETYREISNMGEPPWEALCGSIREENHLQEADAVLAVIDVDAVRAEAQVKALREAADDWHEEHVGTRPVPYKWLHGRADRIAREAGIDSKGESND